MSLRHWWRRRNRDRRVAQMTPAEIKEAKRLSREGRGPHIVTKRGIAQVRRWGASPELLRAAQRGYELNPIPNPEDKRS